MEFQGITTFVIKVAELCNLNCSYCYMYNMGDKTYLNRPKFISFEIIDELAKKLLSHSKKYNLQQIMIAFHGGEPLLWGVENLIKAKNIISKYFEDEKIYNHVIFTMQTNGVQLDKTIVKKLVDNEIYIGISHDGVKSVHDKYRVDHKGRGSFDKIIDKIKIVKEIQGTAGILTVVNLENNPTDYYNFLLELDIDSINVILLDANYEKLPATYETNNDLKNISYGKWLAKLFDVWIENINKKRIKIDTFDHILGLLINNNYPGNQFFGRGYNDVVTIESDGSIEAVDILRITKHGYTQNNLNIFDNEIEDIQSIESFNLSYFSHQIICKECSLCDLKNICGGGMVAHRFKSENEFNNPSVYCEDIKYIINHINNYLINIVEETHENIN